MCILSYNNIMSWVIINHMLITFQLNNLMVVGYDSYHDSVKKNMSVGGFVASLNKPLTKYYSKCTFQHNSQELVDQLVICMIS